MGQVAAMAAASATNRTSGASGTGLNLRPAAYKAAAGEKGKGEEKVMLNRTFLSR